MAVSLLNTDGSIKKVGVVRDGGMISYIKKVVEKAGIDYSLLQLSEISWTMCFLETFWDNAEFGKIVPVTWTN